MKLPDRLSRLDQQGIPLAARKVRRWADRIAVQRTKLQGQRERLRAVRPADLDARYAATGPLAVVRDLPQVGFVVIALVLMAGAGTAIIRQEPPRPAASTGLPGVEPSAAPGLRLGPEVGEVTADYERFARAGLVQAAKDQPTTRLHALVTFRGYRTPAQLQTDLGGFPVKRVYLRAGVAGEEAGPVPYDIRGELGAGLRRAYRATAMSRLALRRTYLAYVATTKNDKAFQDDYQRYADSAGREVTAYQKGCACVFSAIVEAPASVLLTLQGRAVIRAVEVAGTGVPLTQLLVQPLLPETKGVVVKSPLVGEVVP